MLDQSHAVHALSASARIDQNACRGGDATRTHPAKIGGWILLSRGRKSQKQSIESPGLVLGHGLLVFSAPGPKYFSFVLCFLSLRVSVTSQKTKDGALRVSSKTLLMFI